MIKIRMAPDYTNNTGKCFLKRNHKKYIEVLKKRIISYYGKRLISIVIYGSLARGTATPESDIDMILIVKGLHKRKMKRIEEFIKNIEDKLGDMPFYISPIFKTPEEASHGSPLFIDMVYDSIILYDKDDFFKQILERLRQRLEGHGSIRVFKGSRWYWILKPDIKRGEVFEI